MTAWLERYKPRLRPQSQLLLAESMWSLVGSALLTLGLYWVLRGYGGPGLVYATPFLALGLAKAFLILDGVATRAISRIEQRGTSRCALGFFSTGTWLLILAMMAAGQVLRVSSLPRADIGFFYVAVGFALLVSSRMLWRSWLRYPTRPIGPG